MTFDENDNRQNSAGAGPYEKYFRMKGAAVTRGAMCI